MFQSVSLSHVCVYGGSVDGSFPSVNGMARQDALNLKHLTFNFLHSFVFSTENCFSTLYPLIRVRIDN